MDNYLKDGLYKESMIPVKRTFTGTNVDDTVAKIIKKIHEADKDKQREAIEYIEGQLEDGYIDLSGIHEELELEIVKKAIQEYKKNHNIKTLTDIELKDTVMKIRTNMDLFPPSERDVYLEVGRIIRDKLGFGLVEIQNNQSVRAFDKYDELVLKFVKE